MRISDWSSDVCSSDLAMPDAAADVAAATGATVATLETVLADPDIAGVVIASATDTHLDYSVRAITAGKAVFCEKPIDMDLARVRSAAAPLGAPGTRDRKSTRLNSSH